MRDLARAFRLGLRVGMVGTTGHENEVAAVRVLAAEAVATAGSGKLHRRAAGGARGHDGTMQGVDALPVRHIERDANDGGRSAAMQAEDVVVRPGPPKQPRAVTRLHRPQAPDVLVELRGLVEIGGDELDAAHAADDTFRHGC